MVLRIARGRLNIRFGHCTSCLFDNSSVKLCKHDTPFHSCRKARMMSRVWGGTAFAKRSAAMKAPVGLLSGSAVCDSRWRGVAPTSATPTRSLRKCRRIVEVKSRMDRKFSRYNSRKRKIPPCKTGEKFCRVNRRQNESGVLRSGKSFRENPR